MHVSFKPLLIISLIFSQTTFAENTIQVQKAGGGNIHGSQMMVTGTTSTIWADKKDPFYTIGWVLIVIGSIAGDPADATEFSEKQVWDAVVRESSVIQRIPSLAQQDTTLLSASQALSVPANVLVNMVLTVNAETRLAQSKGQNVQTDALMKKLFPKGASVEQTKSLQNMIQLASAM